MSEYPSDWEKTTFGSVLNQRKEAGYPNEELLAVTSSMGIVRRDSLERRDTSNEDKSKYLLVEKGDIAYNTMRMWQGVSGVSRFRGIASPAYTICTPTERLDANFAGYLLKGPEIVSVFRQRSQGLVSDTWNLKYESFAQIPCTIPPLPEQKKIAEILSGIDLLTRNQEKKLRVLANLQAALVEEIALGKNEQGERKSTDIGECPARWESVQLGEVADFANGNSFKSDEWVEEGYPIIRIQNLNGGTDFNYFDGEVNTSWFVPSGSLLFAWSGQRGKSFGPFLWHGADGVLNQHIFKVTHSEQIYKPFLFLLLKMVQIKAEREAHGFKDSFMHVKKSEITSAIVGIPSFARQKELAAAYEHIYQQIKLERCKLASFVKLKSSCSSDLLSGRKRVSV